MVNELRAHILKHARFSGKADAVLPCKMLSCRPRGLSGHEGDLIVNNV